MDLSFAFIDLQNRLAKEQSDKEKVLERVRELEEESEAAALLLETSEQAVNVLLEQLEDARLKILSDGSGESQEAVRKMVNELDHFRQQESDMKTQKERLEADLELSIRKSDRLTAELEEAMAENQKLAVELKAAQESASQMNSQVTGIWSQYAAEQQNLQNQLEQAVQEWEQEKKVNKQLELANMDKEDDIGRMEQMAADLQTKAINERNRAAKLEEENKTLSMECERLQGMLMQEDTNGYEAQALFPVYESLKALRGYLSEATQDTRQLSDQLHQLVIRCMKEVRTVVRPREANSPDQAHMESRIPSSNRHLDRELNSRLPGSRQQNINVRPYDSISSWYQARQ
ncbi:hypothetical protein BSKO_12817 [Bryopsis sp. KO-2023]|nr:hypothetical protein BSKO_12817 [Bryopsis sp. KO-2023]